MSQRLSNIWKFVTYDTWRITKSEIIRTKLSIYDIIKTIYLCVNRFNRDRIVNKASALTYSTLLAIMPILAIVFAIARGFGVSTLVESQSRDGFGGSTEATDIILQFVDSYLSQTRNGILIGVGLVMLLWTVLNLASNIEITFSRIWQVKKGRSMYHKITDYFSMFLPMPILIVVSGGLSIFVGTILKNMTDFALLAPILKFLTYLTPFVLTRLTFTGLYIFMPNTKVKFRHALISGILAGSAYQTFQFLHINSQLWVSKYNAIYGSFATPPMFLLWLQISWTICLFGAELTYAGQNIRNFSFDRNTQNISRCYQGFISILIMSLIAKRSENNKTPYAAGEIFEKHRIPIRLTNQILYQLREIHLVHEVVIDQKSEGIAYQPSIDINQLNVALLLDRLDIYGSEDFKVDKDEEFSERWKVLLDSREEYCKKAGKVPLKGL